MLPDRRNNYEWSNTNWLTGVTLNFVANENKPYYQLPATAGAGTTKYPFDGLSDEDSNITITVGT